MLPECAWYCKDTYATTFRINLQIINNEMMILVGHKGHTIQLL